MSETVRVRAPSLRSFQIQSVACVQEQGPAPPMDRRARAGGTSDSGCVLGVLSLRRCFEYSDDRSFLDLVSLRCRRGRVGDSEFGGSGQAAEFPHRPQEDGSRPAAVGQIGQFGNVVERDPPHSVCLSFAAYGGFEFGVGVALEGEHFLGVVRYLT